MSQVLTCPNCGATAEIGAGIESGSFVCSKCKSTIGFGPGQTVVLSATTVEDQLVGRRLGGYEIKELLGAGGMGKVYLATQVSINRPVALKVLAARFSQDENFTKRFVREAQSAGRLLHPNLVTVFDAGQENDTYFFSMEYVEGEALSKKVFEGGGLPAGEALRIVRQVAEALQYAYERGIIHRDIKPDNIMITPKGRVKLADLGLAKIIEGDGGESGLTVAGAVMGTPHYLAPEQARDSKDVDQRADIYSLGCTFYNMLTGHVPFSGSSTYEILKRHETEEPEFPEESGIPEPVKALVCAMMAKSKEDRPQTPAEVMAAIDAIPGVPGRGGSSTGGLTTQPVGGGYSTPTPGVTSPIGSGSVPATEAAPPKKRKLRRWLIAAAVVIVLLLIASSIKSQEAAKRYRAAENYAKKHGEDVEGVLKRYGDVAKQYPETEWGKKSSQAVEFYEVARYADENPEETEEILKKYEEVASKLEGTEWAGMAKEAILDVAISRVEESLLEGPGKLDKLLEDLGQIMDKTADQQFAENLSKKIQTLRKARSRGVELEQRRFNEELQKLFKEGKFKEALGRIEIVPKDKSVMIVPRNLKERTEAMAEIAGVVRGFYGAAQAKDWEKAAEYLDSAQIDDEKKKKGVQFIVALFMGVSNAQDYKLLEITPDINAGTAEVKGMLTVNRRGIGGRTDAKSIQVENHCVRRDGKWYLSMEKPGERRNGEDRERPHPPPRGTRRPSRK